MKKYKLAKDMLGIASKGTCVEVGVGAPIAIWSNIVRVTAFNLPKLISEGWIEEVKPREWHVVVNKFNNVIGYGNVDKRVSEQYRLQNYGDRLDDFEVTHVQEID